MEEKEHRVTRANYAGDMCILELTDLFVDISKYVEKLSQPYSSVNKIKIILEDDKEGLYLDLEDIESLKNQLKTLTSDVKENDDEITRFAKITTSIRKNIKYNLGKTGSRNIGSSGNFKEGLLKGKCVCIGYALITKMALEMKGIRNEVETNQLSEDEAGGHAWNNVFLEGNWYNWDMTNVGAETLTAKTMGKCLKSDEQMVKLGKIYKGVGLKRENGIVCRTEPSQDLINRINQAIRENISNVPRLEKDTFFSKLYTKILNIFGKKKIYTLQAPNIIEKSPTQIQKEQNTNPWELSDDYKEKVNEVQNTHKDNNYIQRRDDIQEKDE